MDFQENAQVTESCSSYLDKLQPYCSHTCFLIAILRSRAQVDSQSLDQLGELVLRHVSQQEFNQIILARLAEDQPVHCKGAPQGAKQLSAPCQRQRRLMTLNARTALNREDPVGNQIIFTVAACLSGHIEDRDPWVLVTGLKSLLSMPQAQVLAHRMTLVAVNTAWSDINIRPG